MSDIQHGQATPHLYDMAPYSPPPHWEAKTDKTPV